jgi:putative ABC transport system permease protein
MLFNLSRKNFKKSIRDYSVYFFTLILGVAVFYIFNAIETQTAMMEVTKAKAEIIDMMNSALEAVSIFVSFILGYLIVYASRFMLKKRKKEFAVYLTLGMKKTQISGMLWIETVFMGIIHWEQDFWWELVFLSSCPFLCRKFLRQIYQNLFLPCQEKRL